MTFSLDSETNVMQKLERANEPMRIFSLVSVPDLFIGEQAIFSVLMIVVFAIFGLQSDQ
jgi:hypothetical protein